MDGCIDVMTAICSLGRVTTSLLTFLLPLHFTINLYVTNSLHFLLLCYHFTSLFTFVLPLHFTIYIYVTTSLHHLPLCYHFTIFLMLSLHFIFTFIYHFISLFTYILPLNFIFYLCVTTSLFTFMLSLHSILTLFTTSRHYLPLCYHFTSLFTFMLPLHSTYSTLLYCTCRCRLVYVTDVYFSVMLCVYGGQYTKCFRQLQNVWLLWYVTSAPRVSIAAAIVRRTS